MPVPETDERLWTLEPPVQSDNLWAESPGLLQRPQPGRHPFDNIRFYKTYVIVGEQKNIRSKLITSHFRPKIIAFGKAKILLGRHHDDILVRPVERLQQTVPA